jgi:hypothetical protein
MRSIRRENRSVTSIFGHEVSIPYSQGNRKLCQPRKVGNMSRQL